MNAEVKAKWIAALRSGDYCQCSMALHRSNNRYCCLGVLYEVTGGQWSARPHVGDYATETGEFALLSAETLERAAMTDEQQHTLSNMNDAGQSFAEIADFIEANL